MRQLRQELLYRFFYPTACLYNGLQSLIVGNLQRGFCVFFYLRTEHVTPLPVVLKQHLTNF